MCNGENYIQDAIKSVLEQSFQNFEFIIVNDGSTDNTQSIIDSFEDKRIRCIVHSKPFGVAASLNEAMISAKGTLIARMDADDISHPERLMKQVDFMQKNQDIVLCGTWVQTFGERKVVWRYPKTHEEIRVELLFGSPFAHPSIMFRRDIFLSNKFFYSPRFSKSEDYELWTRVASKDLKMANISDILLNYRIHSTQVSQKFREIQKSESAVIRKLYANSIGLKSNITDILTKPDNTKSAKELSELYSALKKYFAITSANKELHSIILRYLTPMLRNSLHDVINYLETELIRFEKYSLIIYGCGSVTQYFLNYIKKKNVVYIIDKNKCNFHSTAVNSLDEIRKIPIDSIFVNSILDYDQAVTVNIQIKKKFKTVPVISMYDYFMRDKNVQ